MQFVLVIHHGSYPLPGTPQGESVSEEERKSAYAGWAAIDEMENVAGGPPLGLPENATTVRVENGSAVTQWRRPSCGRYPWSRVYIVRAKGPYPTRHRSPLRRRAGCLSYSKMERLIAGLMSFACSAN